MTGSTARRSSTERQSSFTGSQSDAPQTRYAYDGAGRLCRVLEAATTDLQSLAIPCTTAVSGATTTNVSTRYVYDDNGNLTAMVDAKGNQTSYGYDPSGRMTSLTDADGKSLAWSYDAAGNRVSQTNRTTTNTPITWTYDELNRMTSRSADGVTVSYTYDGNSNRLTAGDGTRTITTVYDPLNRPTSVTTSDDPGAATTYTYSLSSPSWTDPTGAYAATLDRFGRQTSVTDPIHPGAPFTTTYGADGQPTAMTAPNGNATAFTYDQLGRPLTRTTTGTGGVARASYTWTRNAAGNVRSEASAVPGDATNGTAAYGYDPLGRLTTYTAPPGITSQTASWEAVPNRASLQLGAGTPVTTSYDPANRPSGDSAGGTYTSDLDGRLLTMPGHVLGYDSLGRLAADTTGGATSQYTYDPLDRLRTVTRQSAVQRFRYVGTTTAMAQVLDGAGTVLRSIGTDWTGTHLLDWTGTGANQRIYGTNGHGDLTWTADGTGAVSASVRYDPWGVKQVSNGSLPDFRFQGSWSDAATGLTWAVNRWYAPGLGRFLTEDALLGDTEESASRNLYAYGTGDPVGRVDSDGLQWWKWGSYGPDSLPDLAWRFLGGRANWPAIYNMNRNRMSNPAGASTQFPVGSCIYIPITQLYLRDRRNTCVPSSTYLTGDPDSHVDGDQFVLQAAETIFGQRREWYLMTRAQLIKATNSLVHRTYDPSGWRHILYSADLAIGDRIAIGLSPFLGRRLASALLYQRVRGPAGIELVFGHPLLPTPGNRASTIGHYVFVRRSLYGHVSTGLLAHEYIHVLQWEASPLFGPLYLKGMTQGTGPDNEIEAIAYLWGAFAHYYQRFDGSRDLPWTVYRPL